MIHNHRLSICFVIVVMLIIVSLGYYCCYCYCCYIMLCYITQMPCAYVMLCLSFSYNNKFEESLKQSLTLASYYKKKKLHYCINPRDS